MKKLLTNIFYSFPLRLLLLHFRSNLLLIIIWILLTLFLTGQLGPKFGIQYLFLSPEYLGIVGFWGFFFLGMAFAAFAMSWNLTTYLLCAHHFPFLASLERPFTKYCLNNGLIPLIFVIIFFFRLGSFQTHDELVLSEKILLNGFGFLLGIIALVSFIAAYFAFTNKDILSYQNDRKNKPPNLLNFPDPGRRGPDIEAIRSDKNGWRISVYLNESFRPRLVRSVAHYDARILLKVFRQNHTNALLVQLFSLVILVILGCLIENPYCRIPAGASIFLLCSIAVAITGAIVYWFQRWRLFVLLFLIFGINELTKLDFLNHTNKAYGLNYQVPKAIYNYQELEKICSPENVKEDIDNGIQILNKWHKRVRKNKEDKPKMLLYCVSGGGLKSSVWSMRVLQKADSLTNGQLMAHTVLVSGASGGMIGTAYFRELYLQQMEGEPVDRFSNYYTDNIAKDLLNSIAFTIVTNDLFVPWANFEKGGYEYKKDRGYILEKQLNENVENAFDKTLLDYRAAEQEALVPMFFITPSIVNDARRLIISSQGVSYMMAAPIGLKVPGAVEIDAVDFGRLFKEQHSENLQFATALRMNATYPYILPNVYLPTEPVIEVMDAGFRDNFGLKSAIRFMHVYKDWIKENTSGVALVLVRAYDRNKSISSSDNQGVFGSFLNPLGIAGQILSLQDYEHDTNLGFIYDLLGEENFEIIRFTYIPSKERKDSPISFHLTTREKIDIVKAIDTPRNKASLDRIKKILE